MGNKKYVCHISGQGEKWVVNRENDHQWGIVPSECSIGFHWLPKSEYRLCKPPELWEDVTEQCDVVKDAVNSEVQCVHHNGAARFVTAWNGQAYRLRKVSVKGSTYPKMAFIVEKKVQP